MRTLLLYRLVFPNGKTYIGITSKSLKRRVIVHRSHARGGRDYPLHRAIRKFGYEGFRAETLVVCADMDYLCDLERIAIAAFMTLAPHGYNVAEGGRAPMIGRKVSAGTREIMSRRGKARAKIQNGLPGRIGNKATQGYRHSDDAKRRIADSGRGAIFSPERRAKIGATKIGNKYNVGRSCSRETRDKIAAAQKGRPLTATHRSALTGIRKGIPWSAARRAAQENRRSRG